MTGSGISSPDEGEEFESKFSWLDSLARHPIFSPFSVSSQGKWKTVQDVLTEKTCMVLRGSDILVAHGKELRMTSLIDAKFQSTQQQDLPSSSSSTTNFNPLQNATYKRLLSPALDFEIEQLIVNPSGTLLAIVGSYKVVVIILPRSSALNQHKAIGKKGDATTKPPGEIKVKGALVGAYYHHERVAGRMRLADVKWHPWGEMGSSLLIMTKDGILREYNVSTDFEEPVQTVSLLPGHLPVQDQTPSKLRPRFNRGARSRSQTPVAAAALARSRRSTSRLAFDDRSDSEEESRMDDLAGDESFYTAAGSIRSVGGQTRTAVSFTFGIDERALAGKEGDEFSKSASGFISPDWTPFTIFALCTNGDLYSLCPFMPKKASIRSSYLHSLASYVSLSRPDTISAGSGEEGDLQVRFITSLLKQASAQRTTANAPASTPIALRARSSTPMALDESRGSTREPEETMVYSELVNVQAPSPTIIPSQPQSQGPFLLTPAPHEISEEREARGADLFYARITQEDEGLNVIGIASDDGRIDLCISLEPIMPNWTSSKPSSKLKSKFNPAKSGRYALSDSEDEEEDGLEGFADEEDQKSLPSLFVYESIDLGILSAMKDVYDFEDALRTTPIRFVSDPFYPEIIYVHHLAGAHAIGFGRWSKDIVRALSSEFDAGSLERTLHRGTPSEVACVVNSVPSKGLLSSETAINPICSLCIVSDVYLEYSFLALAHSGRLVALKFDFQLDDDDNFHDAQERFAGENSFAIDKDVRSALEGDLSQMGGSIPNLYISLLDSEFPFTMPKPFEGFHGLPSQPRIAPGNVMGGSNKAELRVTPETLRSLGTIVETLRGQMREITRGGESIQTRIDLQAKEMKRQLDKIDFIAKRIESNRKGNDKVTTTTNSTSIEKRMKRILESQKTMIRRSDRLLQKLIDQHSPELSVYEQRWLAELTQMQKDLGKEEKVKVEEDDDDDKETTSLIARVDALRHQLESLKPELQRSSSNPKTNGNGEELKHPKLFGTNQLRDMETLLANEEKLLETDTRKINHLNTLIQRQIRTASQSLM